MDLEKLTRPFWETDIVIDETILPLSERDGLADAPLIFRPTEIISVMSADLKTRYEEGKDWVLKNGRIVRPRGSAMPYMKAQELRFPEDKEGESFAAKEGGYVLYKNKAYFHKRQSVVTYRHDDSFVMPEIPKDRLPRLHRFLEAGEAVRLCFYGDSITAGCDGSGQLGVEPYMPGWPELIKAELNRRYGSEVEIINTAVGGMRSDWGAENAVERLAQYKPDAAVIAFGMNDGTEKIPSEKFRQNIMEIKEKALAENSRTEFILVATTLANPESVFAYCQEEYYQELCACASKSDVVINMTDVHNRLLKRKRFLDLTGNNINHPNDFLIRVYAQAILSAF